MSRQCPHRRSNSLGTFHSPQNIDLATAHHILGMRVDATSYEEACGAVLRWADAGESRYVCAATVHMTMEAFDRSEYRRIVNAADLVTPDGMPLVWALRLLGRRGQGRVYGPDLMVEVLDGAARTGVPVGLYGGRPEVLERLLAELGRRFPALSVVYAASPPFSPMTKAEQQATVEEINASGARVLFVGLGCPKQERWMAERRGEVRAVMLGVGAAFDFLAGTTPQAPRWMMRVGLEWLFRLITEPRRLWKRYLKNNPRFLMLFLFQRIGLQRFE
jgi:N-acetylglucosaminyldiphosphoundecaprenol N-acetyl-beta-D-mannosaminyltransferase